MMICMVLFVAGATEVPFPIPDRDVMVRAGALCGGADGETASYQV